VYGQGLEGSTLNALTSDEASRTWAAGAGADASAAFGGYGALAALSNDGSQSLQDRLAQLQQQAATHGLQNGMALQRTMTGASVFALNASVVLTIPMLNIPFFFGLGMLGGLPPLPPPKNDKGPGH
jgi:hypothetical protein